MEDISRPSSYSETTITELMIPSYANFGGKIHGGILLSLMDKVAYACASKHAGNYCVTVSVDGVDFLQPIEVGELVSLKARINYVGKTSLVVGIKVIAENVKEGKVKHTNTCFFTMVAKNEKNKLVEVPKLILQTKVDVRRFMEAIIRRYLKRQHKSEMSAAKDKFNTSSMIKKLEGERCIISLNDD